MKTNDEELAWIWCLCQAEEISSTEAALFCVMGLQRAGFRQSSALLDKGIFDCMMLPPAPLHLTFISDLMVHRLVYDHLLTVVTSYATIVIHILSS